MNQQQEAYMPEKGMLKSVVVMQTPMIEPLLVEILTTSEPEDRKQTP